MDYLSILEAVAVAPVLTPDRCPHCNVEMELYNHIEMECANCGYSRIGTDLEVTATAAASNFPMQDQMRTYGHIVTYSETRRKATFTEVLAVYKANMHLDIPEDVYNSTAQIFCKIQDANKTYRSNVRRGIMAALFYRLCTAHCCTIKPATVARIWGIIPRALSTGQKELDKLISNGLIRDPLPINYRKNNAESALRRVRRAVLSSTPAAAQASAASTAGTNTSTIIPDNTQVTQASLEVTLDNYLKFAERLVEFTNKYHIATSSVTTSKVAGALYVMYTNCSDYPITITQIEAACSCVKTTAKRYSDEISKFLALPVTSGHNVDLAQARLRTLFAHHGIPLVARKKVQVRAAKKVLDTRVLSW